MHALPRYPFPASTQFGLVREVAANIYWIRMPLPYALNHINVWLLRDHDSWTVVDTGVATLQTQQIWRDVIASLCGRQRVDRVIVTHFHPDHVGNAGWFQRNFSAETWMSQSEWLLARLLAADTSEETHNNNVAFFKRCDVEDDKLRLYVRRGETFAANVASVPRQYRRIRDSETIDVNGQSWKIIIGQGHSPEQVCLYCQDLKLLLCGDQLLPKITPIIGIHPMEPDDDPLGDYLASFDRFSDIDPETLVLPAHERPFKGVHQRIAVMKAHHAARLEAILNACASPITARRCVDLAFHREFDVESLRFAVTESLAHLNRLIRQGQLTRTLRDDGVWLFARS